jgi:hypothetical protein
MFKKLWKDKNGDANAEGTVSFAIYVFAITVIGFIIYILTKKMYF